MSERRVGVKVIGKMNILSLTRMLERFTRFIFARPPSSTRTLTTMPQLTLSRSTPAGRAASLINEVYGQFVPELTVAEGDKVSNPKRLLPPTVPS